MSLTEMNRVEEKVLKGSPSQRFNNLSLSSSNYAAYVEKNQVRVESTSSGDTDATTVPIGQVSTVLQARFVTIDCKEYLAVTTPEGVHLFDALGQKHLASLSVDVIPQDEDNKDNPINAPYCCGVDGVQGTSYCVVGTSFGPVALCHFNARRGKLDLEQTLFGHRRAICTVSSSVSYLASGDESGRVIVWNTGAYELQCQFPSMGLPCSSILIRTNKIIAGFVSGVVRVYDVAGSRLEIEIDAHCRSLNAMDIHPLLDAFATAGDDGYVNVWQLPSKLKDTVRLVSSHRRENEMLVGVAFAKDGSDRLASASYDSKRLVVYS